MAVVGGAMTATGGILFWRAMTVDDLGDAALLGITSFPLSISGITILAIGTAGSIKYRMWLSRLNLSAQIGRNNDAIKLTYNF